MHMMSLSTAYIIKLSNAQPLTMTTIIKSCSIRTEAQTQYLLCRCGEGGGGGGGGVNRHFL